MDFHLQNNVALMGGGISPLTSMMPQVSSGLPTSMGAFPSAMQMIQINVGSADASSLGAESVWATNPFAASAFGGTILSSANQNTMQQFAQSFFTMQLKQMMEEMLLIMALIMGTKKNGSDKNHQGGGGGSDSGGGSSASAAGAASGAQNASAGGNVPTVMRQGKPIGSAVAPAFDAMVAAAKKDGVNLTIVSGYRSHAEQVALWNANPDPARVARPGTSNHEKGTAIDFGNTPGAYEWLKQNAARFGLHNYPAEAWHYSLNGH